MRDKNLGELGVLAREIEVGILFSREDRKDRKGMRDGILAGLASFLRRRTGAREKAVERQFSREAAKIAKE